MLRLEPTAAHMLAGQPHPTGHPQPITLRMLWREAGEGSDSGRSGLFSEPPLFLQGTHGWFGA